MKKNLIILSILLLFFGSMSANDKIRDISAVGARTEAVDHQLYHGVYYISIRHGSDKDGDGSKEHPWQTLTAGLAKLTDASADHRFAVLAAAGTYSSATVVMKDWIDLYGGFCPETWQRDIFKHQTILDGLNVRRVVVGANNARLDGFVITHGIARSHGAGILCMDVSPTISNNFIIDNMVLEPENFDFQHIHQPGNHGGGIACLYNAVPVIRNNIIASNKTSVGCGGGVAFYGWLRIEGIEEPVVRDNFLVGGLQPVLENNVIVNNISGLNDIHRTRSSSGGAVFCAYEARPIIQNNIIAGNRAVGRSDAGGIYCEYYSYPVIEGNWIVGNVCDDDGGGIYTMRCGQPLIQSNFIAGNWTTGGGVGGVRLSKEGRARIVDNVIVHNQSGGGVNSTDSYIELEKNIIMHNRGGGAITYVQHFIYLMPSTIRNNIMRENEKTPIIFGEDIGKPLIIQHNNIEGGFAGSGNYDVTPVFSDESIQGKAKSANFNPVSYTTTVLLQKTIETNVRLAGRVLRLGSQWSVIQSAENKMIILWGDVGDAAQNSLDYEIISQYRLK